MQGMNYEGDVHDHEVEPPVPAGLRSLSTPLERLADFLGIDFDLIAAAAEQSEDESQLRMSGAEILVWVRNLPQDEKDSLLVRIIEDDVSHAQETLRQRVLSEMLSPRQVTGGSVRRRTAAQILTRADTITKERQRTEAERAEQERLQRELEQAELRRRHLESLRGRETDLWAKASQLIITKQPRKYDEAVLILQDLRDLADRVGVSSAFCQRMACLWRDHASKPTLLQRFQKAGLLAQPVIAGN